MAKGPQQGEVRRRLGHSYSNAAVAKGTAELWVVARPGFVGRRGSGLLHKTIAAARRGPGPSSSVSWQCQCMAAGRASQSEQHLVGKWLVPRECPEVLRWLGTPFVLGSLHGGPGLSAAFGNRPKSDPALSPGS